MNSATRQELLRVLGELAPRRSIRPVAGQSVLHGRQAYIESDLGRGRRGFARSRQDAS